MHLTENLSGRRLWLLPALVILASGILLIQGIESSLPGPYDYSPSFTLTFHPDVLELLTRAPERVDWREVTNPLSIRTGTSIYHSGQSAKDIELAPSVLVRLYPGTEVHFDYGLKEDSWTVVLVRGKVRFERGESIRFDRTFFIQVANLTFSTRELLRADFQTAAQHTSDTGGALASILEGDTVAKSSPGTANPEIRLTRGEQLTGLGDPQPFKRRIPLLISSPAYDSLIFDGSNLEVKWTVDPKLSYENPMIAEFSADPDFKTIIAEKRVGATYPPLKEGRIQLEIPNGYAEEVAYMRVRLMRAMFASEPVRVRIHRKTAPEMIFPTANANLSCGEALTFVWNEEKETIHTEVERRFRVIEEKMSDWNSEIQKTSDHLLKIQIPPANSHVEQQFRMRNFFSDHQFGAWSEWRTIACGEKK